MPFDQPFRLLANPNHGVPGVVTLNAAGFRRARAEIMGWPNYRPTPLAALGAAAAQARVAAVHIKDECPRFGLGSVKALGGAYAVLGVLRSELARRGGAAHTTAAALEAGAHADAAGAVTVCCAADGNHGCSVAWGARRFGARCVVFVHAGVSGGLPDAIGAYGAEVRKVVGTYDDAIRTAAATAEREGWTVVSDTSWPGYTEIPREVMQGYRLMVDEALDQIPAPPTHIFVQAGVGGVAAAVAVHARARLLETPVLGVVEPEAAAGLLASAEAGHLATAPGPLNTVMAGLACGTPSLLAWQELDRSASAFLAVPDAAAVDGVRLLAGLGMVSGAAGAAGLAGLMLAAADPAARAALGLDERSRVLLFSTEGAIDSALHARLIA